MGKDYCGTSVPFTRHGRADAQKMRASYSISRFPIMCNNTRFGGYVVGQRGLIRVMANSKNVRQQVVKIESLSREMYIPHLDQTLTVGPYLIPPQRVGRYTAGAEG